MVGGIGEHLMALSVNSPLSSLALNALVALLDNLGFIRALSLAGIMITFFAELMLLH